LPESAENGVASIDGQTYADAAHNMKRDLETGSRHPAKDARGPMITWENMAKY
jgi:hypothetical protein